MDTFDQLCDKDMMMNPYGYFYMLKKKCNKNILNRINAKRTETKQMKLIGLVVGD